MLLEQLGQNHQGALKKFQSNFGKSIQVDKSEETKEPQAPKNDKGSIAQVESSAIGAEVQHQAFEIEANSKLARTLAINTKGKIIINEDLQSDEEDEARYLSYITNEDFECLDKRYFGLGEIANLLASSDLRQRMFALNILLKAVLGLGPKDDQHFFGVVLHPDFI